MIREAIARIAGGEDLTEDEASTVMEEIMTDAATPSQIGAFLIGMRMKGETVDEIAGMARVMREKALRVYSKEAVLDVVSTGGGAFDPFNISTAAAIVCAATGVRVAKHGNRGFTSASGAADVLEALGAKIEMSPEQAEACLDRCGFVFMLAPSFHPAMRFAGPTRREIGVRTIFNSLGPLTNPAGAQNLLMGAGTAALAEKIAAVLARLGSPRSMVVHGDDGLDEVTLSGATTVYEITGNEMHSYKITPDDAGLPVTMLDAVRTGTAAENAGRMTALFGGGRGADRDYVLMNAGLALVVAGKAPDLKAGVALAAETIDSGAAGEKLAAYISASNGA